MTESPAQYAEHQHPDLSIDQQLALRTAATRLQREFAKQFGVETIERFLYTSYDQFAGRATVPNFLPLLAERFARQRLNALARVEGKITDTNTFTPWIRIYGPTGKLLGSGYGAIAGEVAVTATNSGTFIVVASDGNAATIVSLSRRCQPILRVRPAQKRSALHRLP